jgi:cell division protein FtsB
MEDKNLTDETVVLATIPQPAEKSEAEEGATEEMKTIPSETKKAAKKEPKKGPKKNPQNGVGINRIYLVVSLVIIVALAGAGAYFYSKHTVRIDELNTELASLTDANRAYESESADKSVLIADYENQISELKADVEAGEAEVASLREDIGEYESSSDYYAAYNGLIAFANQNTGSSSLKMFASDTVLHLTTEDVMFYVYVSENTSINAVVENRDIATIEVIGWSNDNIAILKVVPGTTAGSTKITLTAGDASSDSDESDDDEEDTDSDKVEIFVYSD